MSRKPERYGELARSIALHVVEMLRADGAIMPPAKDPLRLHDRKSAARILNMSVRSFDAERVRVPDLLKPAGTTGPMKVRWTEGVLDLYRMTGGNPILAKHFRR